MLIDSKWELSPKNDRKKKPILGRLEFVGRAMC